MTQSNKNQIKKRQHIVPQLILRRFCNEEGKLVVYDKKNEIV
jgi:hypothetical protein